MSFGQFTQDTFAQKKVCGVVLRGRFAFALWMGFFGNFWRGQYGFVVTVLLLIGVTVAFFVVADVVPAGVLIFGLLGASVWQITGGVRFAERVMRDGGLTRVYGIYSALGVAVLSNVALGISVALPPPPVDLEVEGYSPKVSLVGDVAFVSGEIDYQILTELKAVRGVRTVELESTGGSVQAGRAIGLLIAASGWDTRVMGQCFSACTLAFAGGVHRDLRPGGRLGFHSYSVDSPLRVQIVNQDDIVEKDRVFLKEQGFAAAFIDQIFSTSFENLWEPSREDLLAAGVIR